eukprot:m.166182 g.166182  ORF g.166182 m.166182 type:complete len:57 (-) comp18149_c0_seq1:1321-1491(-)
MQVLVSIINSIKNVPQSFKSDAFWRVDNEDIDSSTIHACGIGPCLLCLGTANFRTY